MEGRIRVIVEETNCGNACNVSGAKAVVTYKTFEITEGVAGCIAALTQFIAEPVLKKWNVTRSIIGVECLN